MAVPDLERLWLVPAAVLPQLIVFHLPATKHMIPDGLAPVTLVSSQILLLLFVAFNWSKRGFRILGLGLALNLIVILLNGGLMPVSPETVAQMAPNAPINPWHIGERLGTGKDIVLSLDQTRLWFLSDRFLLPDGASTRAALSIGDLLIALGASCMLWFAGGRGERVAYRSQRSPI